MSLFNNASAGSAQPAAGSTGGSGLFSNLGGGAANTTNTASGSLFSNQGKPATGATQAPASSGGLFANTNTSAPSQIQPQASAGTSGLFANAGASTSAQPAAGTTGTGGGGLFSSMGKSTTPAVGGTTTGLSFGGGQTTAGGDANQLNRSIQPVSTYEKYVRACQLSNQYLYDLISERSTSINEKEFKNILNDRIVKEKLSKGLQYYRPRDKTDEASTRELNEGRLKWQGQYQITPLGKDIIISFSQDLNLDKRQTFELLDFYFEFDSNLLRIFADPNTVVTPDVEHQINRLRKIIRKQYYSERIALLDALFLLCLIASSQQTDQKYNRVIAETVADLIQKQRIIDNIWSSYKQISESKAPDTLSELLDTEEWALQTIKEQYYLLKSLFILYQELVDCTPEFFQEMLEYFDKQSFRGSLLSHNNQVTLNELDQKRHVYADMIGDICLLTLINCLKLSNIYKLGSNALANNTQTQNPLNILTKRGKEITDFFNKGNEANMYLPPLMVAWRRLLIWYSERVEDDQQKRRFRELLRDFIEPFDYLSLMCDMKKREIFLNENELTLSYFRITIKEWVSLLSQDLVNDSAGSYEKLVDLACDCLKEEGSLDSFWNHDIRYRTNLATLLYNLLKMFPYKSTKLIKFITALLGNKQQNYALHVLRLLGNMERYTTEIQSPALNYIHVYDLPDREGSQINKSKSVGFGDDEEAYNRKYYTTRSIDEGLIKIPENTRAKLLSHSTSANAAVYQFRFTYNFWFVVYQNWTRTLHQLMVNELKKFNSPMVKLIKLVCKMIIYDPSMAELLEEDLTKEHKSTKVCQSTSTLILLLLDTFYYFQRLPTLPYKLLALILKALAALESHPHYSATLAALIQIYPRTIFSPSPQYTSYMMTSRSTLGLGTTAFNMQGGMNTSKVNDLGHPILEIFYTLKRAENPIEHSAKRYDIYIALLQFAYQIILDNEFIFNRYSNEKFARVFYGANMLNINNNMDEAVSLIMQIHSEYRWNESSIEELNEFLRKKQNSTIFYSTFIDDIFHLIYVAILPNLDKMLFTPDIMDKKWKIGTLLFKITDVLLQKLLVSLDRNLIVTNNSGTGPTSTTNKAAHDNILLSHIVTHLNSSRITDFILKTLEVVVNPEFFKGHVPLDRLSRDSPLGIENSFWTSYITNQNMSPKQIMRGRDFIAQCLSCLEIVINLVEIYNENKTLNSNSEAYIPNRSHAEILSNSSQLNVSRLNLVDEMEKILTKKEFMHYYVYNNPKQPIKINFVLALFSYVNFETIKELSPEIRYDPQTLSNLKETIENAMASEEEIYETGILLNNMNPELARNLFLKNKQKNNQNVSRVSTMATRVLTKLVLLWEDQGALRKPLIYEYITMIANWDKYFNSDVVLTAIITEFMSILYDFENQQEDTCAVIELLIVCLYSQRTFVDLFLKSGFKSMKQQQVSFFGFLETFFSKSLENFKPLLSKLIVFLYEVFTRENHYSAFIQTMRKDGRLMHGIFSSVFKHLTTKYPITDLLSEYCSSCLYRNASPNEIKLLSNQFDKLRVEGLIMKECSNIFATMVAIRFMTQELLKSAKSVLISNYIHGCIQEFFTQYFEGWLAKFTTEASYQRFDARNFNAFLEEFTNRRNLENYNNNNDEMTEEMQRSTIHDASYISGFSNLRGTRDILKNTISLSEVKRVSRKHREAETDEDRAALEEEKANNGANHAGGKRPGQSKRNQSESIMGKSVFKILDINLFGYGKDYVYDTQEVFHTLRSFHYKEDFIYYATLFLNKYNLHQSLISIEHKYFESIIKLFKFVSTLGLNGECFSTIYYDVSGNIFPQYPNLKDIFDNDKECVLANPNFKISFAKGFVELFTKQTNFQVQLTSCTDFLVKCIRIIWKALQDTDQNMEINLAFLQNVEQKIQFLTFSFNAVFYLMKVFPKLNSLSHSKVILPFNETNRTLMNTEGANAILGDRGLMEIINELFRNLNHTTLRKVNESVYYIDQDNTNYIVFLMTFLHCVSESQKQIKLDSTDIMKYLIFLETSAKPTVTCLPIIITCFQQLFRLDSDTFYDYLVSTQGKFIKHSIMKINSEACTDYEFIFILKFFLELARSEKCAAILKNQNIVWELSSNRQFKGLRDLNNYENGVRSSRHFLWCWTLILIRELTKTLHNEAGFMNSVLNFVKEHFERIYKVITLPAASTSADQLGRMEIWESQTSSKFTIAYLEELEITLALLAELFNHSEKWVLINRIQFETILHAFTHYTLKLFKSKLIVNSEFSPATAYEKSLNDIYASYDSAREKNLQIDASPSISGYSPYKSPLAQRPSMEHRISGISATDREQYIHFNTYNPSVLMFKVELSLLKSLFHILGSIKTGFHHTELHLYFEDQERQMELRQRFLYDLSYWDNLCQTLEATQNFLLFTLKKWQANEKFFDRISKKLEYMNNTVECTIQNACLNKCFSSMNFVEGKTLCRMNLELAFFTFVLHVNMFEQFKASENMLVEEIIHKYQEKAYQLLEDAINSLGNKSYGYSTNPLDKARLSKDKSFTISEVVDSGDRDFLMLLTKFFRTK